MINTVLFDLDGTILENEGEWESAFQETADANLIEPIKMRSGWIHEPGIGVARNWKKIVGDEEEAEQLAVQTRDIHRKLCEKHDVRVREGFVEVVDRLREWHWLVGLCTSSEWSGVEKELERLSLYLAFDATTTGEEVLLSKPDPEIYLLSAQKLGVEPQDCLVVEDSLAGVRAGAEAGMKVAGILSEYADEAVLRAAGAEIVVGDMEQLKSELEKMHDQLLANSYDILDS